MINYKKILNNIRTKLIGSKEMRNAGWVIGGRIAQMAIALFVSILTTRYLGVNNYGTINYAAAYVAFFSSFCTLGINSIIIKEFIDHPNEQGVAIGTAIFLRAISSILSELVIVGCVSIINKNEPFTIIVVTLCSIALIFQVTDTINYWFQARYLSKVVSIASLIAYIATTIYRIILLLLQKDVKWFAFASSVDAICMAIIMLIIYHQYGGPKLAVSIKKAKELLKKSQYFIIVHMLVAIYEQIDKIMLQLMINETEVGYYSLAATVNGMWIFVLTAIIDSFTPTILQYGKRDQDKFERKNRQLYSIVIWLSLTVAIVYVCFGREIIRILYGEEYLGATVPLRIICWYTPFFYLVSARNAWMIAKNKQRYLTYLCGGSAVANVVLNFVFIPLWGASGAALASLLTQMLAITIIPYCIKDMRPNVKLMLDAVFLRDIK